MLNKHNNQFYYNDTLSVVRFNLYIHNLICESIAVLVKRILKKKMYVILMKPVSIKLKKIFLQ